MRRIPELDGLRGIAILLVIFCHYLGPIFKIASAGWAGVDLFFVLSGFLIGTILLESRAAPDYYRKFYLRRFFRIVPIYLLVLATFGFYFRAEMLPWYAYPTFTQNFFMGLVAFWPALSQLWSLAVEEQFYIFLPPVVRNWPRAIPAIAVAVILASPIIRLAEFQSHGWTAARFLPFGRLDTLLIGVLVAYYRDRLPNLRWAAFISGAAIVVFGLMGWTDKEPQVAVFGYSVLAVFFGSIVGSSLQGIRWLRSRLLGRIGEVSYCVYLIHLPLLHICVRFGYFSGAIMALALTAAISYLSWRFLESPLITLGRSVYGVKSHIPIMPATSTL